MIDIGEWKEDLSRTTLRSETDVRTHVAVPLLVLLGYPAENQAEEFPIYGYEGETPQNAKHTGHRPVRLP